MSHLNTILIVYVILVNIIAFLMMNIDKRRARHHKYRIPEKHLFAAALAGGSIGAMIGMFLFRHKTRHLKFLIGMPLIFVVQLLLIVLLLSWNQKRISSPSAAVQEQLDLIRTLDEDTIHAYISYQSLTNPQVDGSSFGEEASMAVRRFFQNFRYSIRSEVIAGDAAEVLVDITNIDTNALSKDLCTELLTRSVRIPPEQPVSYSTGDYYQLLNDCLLLHDYDSVTTTAAFHLKQEEDGWTILADEKLEDELVSGFISNINDPYLLSPQTVLKAQLNAFDELTASRWEQYLQPDDLFGMNNDAYSAAIDQAFMEQIAAHFGYEILRCQTQGSRADLDLRVTSLNLKQVLTNYREKLIAYAKSPESARASEQERADQISLLLLECLRENDSSSSTDLKLSMVNNGLTWTVTLGDDFANAIMGDLSGSLDAFREIEQPVEDGRTVNLFETQLQ